MEQLYRTRKVVAIAILCSNFGTRAQDGTVTAEPDTETGSGRTDQITGTVVSTGLVSEKSLTISNLPNPMKSSDTIFSIDDPATFAAATTVTTPNSIEDKKTISSISEATPSLETLSISTSPTQPAAVEATVTDDPIGRSGLGLAGGHIAAIVITVLVLTAGTVLALVLLQRRRKQRRWDVYMAGRDNVSDNETGDDIMLERGMEGTR